MAARPQPAPLAASTLVLGADASVVVLDALFPAPVQRAVHPGTQLAFSARLDGVAVQGTLRVRSIENRSDGDVIFAALPDELLWSQRRAAYRASARDLPASQLLHGGAHFRARLMDLSVLGLGATIATEKPFKVGDHSVWELHLPGGLITAGVRIASAAPSTGSVRLGGLYFDLSAEQRQALQRERSR